MRKIAVTGAAGQIAYSLLFRLCAGEVFQESFELRLLELPEALGALRGVAMELDDSAFPLLRNVVISSDPREVFEDADLALLIGSKPRGPGMERSDLLAENGKIFAAHGKALNDVASADVLVFVVGNPVNTNTLIAMTHAPRIAKERFFSMAGLDHNRAVAMVAQKAGVSPAEVEQTAIWGNHSATQVVDFTHAQIGHRSLLDQIDRKWCEEELLPRVQKRGAEVISVRGKSSAASAAQGVISSLQFLYRPSRHWFSIGISSDGNRYGIEDGLIFSFPCRSLGEGRVEIVPNLSLDPFIREKLAITERELIEERNIAL